ncbi:MAG: hypothetical protein C4529_04545 [Deltaproteobacteria bacterium]|nr:MAG: hypothetical protein C4529_04545 [Deltaproteobacteria bacterium]
MPPPRYRSIVTSPPIVATSPSRSRKSSPSCVTVALPRRTTRRVSSTSVTVSQYLPGSGKWVRPPPGIRTVTGAKSSSGRSYRISPARRRKVDFPSCASRTSRSVPDVSRTNCEPWNCSSASELSGTLIRLLGGSGALFGYSCHSPTSARRTHTDPASTFSRATE